MKKNIILIAAILISTASFSQVGINTENPQGVFNIDGQKIMQLRELPQQRNRQMILPFSPMEMWESEQRHQRTD